jgi:hypothetical protein
MKAVKAYIKPHRLSAGTLAWHETEGLSGMRVSDIRGFAPVSDSRCRFVGAPLVSRHNRKARPCYGSY